MYDLTTASQVTSKPPIRLAEKYKLTIGDKPVGFLQWRVTKHAGNPKINTGWKFSCAMNKQEFNYQKLETGTVRKGFVPEPYDCLGQLAEMGCPEMTIDGIEHGLQESGGCTSMYIKRGEEEGDALDIPSPQLKVWVPTGVGGSSSSEYSDDESASSSSDSDSDAGFCENMDADIPLQPMHKADDEGLSELMGAVAGMTTEQEFKETSDAVRQKIMDVHGLDECSQIFMFGKNYEEVTRHVFLTGEKSDIIDFINPFSVVKMEDYIDFAHGGYGQEILPILDDNNTICGIVQKDPENDPAPCDSEYRLEPSEDKTYWKTIRIICPPKPEIIATAEISGSASSAVCTGRKRNLPSFEPPSPKR